MSMVTGPSWAIAHLAIKYPLVAVVAAGTLAFTTQFDFTHQLPLVAITFDDGYQSVRDIALPEMTSREMVGTHYITYNLIGAGEQYITQQELQDFIVAGWEIGSHGLDHIDMTILPHQDLFTQLSESQQGLADLSGQTITSFSTPYGYHNETVIEVINDFYQTHVNAWSDSNGLNYSHSFDPYNVHRIDFANTSAVEVCYMITNLPQDSMYILIMHNIVEGSNNSENIYDTSQAELITILNCIQSSEVEVVTVSDGIQELRSRGGN